MSLLSLVLCTILLTSVRTSGDNSWNYDLQGPVGPNNWGHHCNGARQSPINIPTKGVAIVNYPPLHLVHYDLPPALASLTNNGHTAKLSTKYSREEVIPTMSGGGLPHKYKLSQLHFHWGQTNSEGSEHRVGDNSFPMELHLVHYKAVHSDIKEALHEGAADSLAVLAIFFQVAEHHNPGLANIVTYLDKIRQPNSQIDVTPFPLSNIMVGDLTRFYRYNGSLTTPDCNEIVQWTVLKEPVPISQAQLDTFRTLLSKEEIPLGNNYRPVQVLGDRQVLEFQTYVPEKSSQRRKASSGATAGFVREILRLKIICMVTLIVTMGHF